MTEAKDGAPASRQRAPRRITPDYLRRAAMHYLERHAAPAEQLRKVLQRKVVRSCRHHGLDPADFAEMVAAAVAACVGSGLVDDRRFAEARAATLRRKGRSARAVFAGLAAKGIARDLVAETVKGTDEDERAAALIAARRKRLGPWSKGDRAASRQKHIATLARAGFSPGIARAVIDGEGEEP